MNQFPNGYCTRAAYIHNSMNAVSKLSTLPLWKSETCGPFFGRQCCVSVRVVRNFVALFSLLIVWMCLDNVSSPQLADFYLVEALFADLHSGQPRLRVPIASPRIYQATAHQTAILFHPRILSEERKCDRNWQGILCESWWKGWGSGPSVTEETGHWAFHKTVWN